MGAAMAMDWMYSSPIPNPTQCSAVQSVLTSSGSTGGGGGDQGFCTSVGRQSSSLSVVILPHLLPCHPLVSVAATRSAAS